tara:strand:- start:512 stop:1213 length:702 start_codon:yes stop_codon:yes gene_type:complete
MKTKVKSLDWCVVRLGDDKNWWVTEISDEVHWDLEGLGIIDPKQMQYIVELTEAYQEYGFQYSILDNAFYTFSITEQMKNGNVKLKRVRDSVVDPDQMIFALPDILDEDKGAYADLLNHITRVRVKMLNEAINFQQNFTVDELEEDIREKQNADFMEGRSTHFFEEIIAILDYVPDGYSLDDDDGRKKSSNENIETFPDIDVEVSDEKIVEDETMKWEEDEEGSSSEKDSPSK